MKGAGDGSGRIEERGRSLLQGIAGVRRPEVRGWSILEG